MYGMSRILRLHGPWICTWTSFRTFSMAPNLAVRFSRSCLSPHSIPAGLLEEIRKGTQTITPDTPRLRAILQEQEFLTLRVTSASSPYDYYPNGYASCCCKVWVGRRICPTSRIPKDASTQYIHMPTPKLYYHTGPCDAMLGTLEVLWFKTVPEQIRARTNIMHFVCLGCWNG